MTLVVVPVRYPLTEHAQQTLETAIAVAREHDADLSVLHVDIYHSGQRIKQSELQHAVEAVFGRLSRVQYAVRSGFLVEETILEEAATEDADLVVIGKEQAGCWRRMIRRLTGDPNVESYLRGKLDCQIITAPCE